MFVFVAGALGALFGVFNDLLTSHLSPAYFVLGKGIPGGEGFLSRVVSLAIKAGFVAGAFGSCFVLYANNPHPLRRRLPYAALYRYLAYPVATAMWLGLLFWIGAQFLAPYPLARKLPPLVPVQDAADFLSVWAIHLGLYVGCVAGIAVAVVRIRRERAHPGVALAAHSSYAALFGGREMGLLDSLMGGGSPAGLGVGERAPDFKLKDQHGKAVSLADFAGRKNVVVYFYPKDDTPGCTKESCTFRDQYTAFTDIGAEVLGISSDSEDSHLKFAEKYKLPFPLLSDGGGAVRKQYKVPKSLGLLPGRVTFVIDKQGVVRHVFNSQLNPTKHVDEAIGVLKTLG